jgi:predicted DNA-binding transcriptional regulator AlpA
MVPQSDQSDTCTLASPDAARYIGMSDSWLRQSRMASRGDGPPFLRVGSRAVRYLRGDLDEWLNRRRCAEGRTQPQVTEPAGPPKAVTPGRPPRGRSRKPIRYRPERKRRASR